ncbi:MAG: hypothetical protein H6725_04735 [Sandaracinaceae bacterium]|nr:hypothetical protein [Sandaracinaceae bacterium]
MPRLSRVMPYSARTRGRVLALALALGCCALSGVSALAQEAPPAAAQEATSGDSPRVLTDPETGERYVEVHPSDALARGRWSVDPWLVWGVGALAAVAGAAVLARRAVRSRRRR